MSESTPVLTAALEKAHLLQHVKLKLPMLTKIGRILMTDIRSDDYVDIEKTRYQFFRQCSLLILGLGFQSLSPHNPERSSFTEMLEKGARQISPKPFPEFCSLFHVLLWLVENHWTHPTLARVLTGMQVDETAVNAWPEATIPELLKIRVEILASADCEQYALNLCRWCSKLPALFTEVTVYTVYFRLLHKFNLMDEFTKLCKCMRCCLGLQVIEASGKHKHILVLVQTFLSVDWLKPTTYCCTKKLLRYWMQIEWQVAPQHIHFLASVTCLTKRAMNSWQVVSLIETMYNLVDRQTQYHPFYLRTLLTALRTDHAELVKTTDDTARHEQTTARLVYGCLVLATTTSTWCARIQRAAMVAAFSLSRRQDAYYAVKEVYSGDLGGIDDVSQCVGEDLVTEVLAVLSGMTECYLNPDLDWPTLQAMCLYRLCGNTARLQTECDIVTPCGSPPQENSVIRTSNSAQPLKPGLLLSLLTGARSNTMRSHPPVVIIDNKDNRKELKQESHCSDVPCTSPLERAESGWSCEVVSSEMLVRTGNGASETPTKAGRVSKVSTKVDKANEMPTKVDRPVKISIIDITDSHETDTNMTQTTALTHTPNVDDCAQNKGVIDYQASYIAYVGQTKCPVSPIAGPVSTWEVHIPESFHWRRRKGSVSAANTRQRTKHYKHKKETVCKTPLHQVVPQSNAKRPPERKNIIVTRSHFHFRNYFGRNSRFPYQGALEEEMRVTKASEKRYQCGLCPVICASHLMVVKHLWETHKIRLMRLKSYKKAFICDLCGHIYVQHKCMWRHMSEHKAIMASLVSSTMKGQSSSEDARLHSTNMHHLILNVTK